MKPTDIITTKSGLTATLYLADCLDVLPTLERVDAVITDPPYGIGWDGENVSMSGGVRVDGSRRKGEHWQGRREAGYDRLAWDGTRQEVPLLAAIGNRAAVVWGGNYYADILPPSGGWLVWDKGVKMPSLSKCELAWTNAHGHVEKYDCLWAGYRKDEPGKRLHPTQKPVDVMAWSISQLPDPLGQTILDLFMGSGTTGVAALRMGCNFIGIEIEPKYYAIAKRRISAEAAQGKLFT